MKSKYYPVEFKVKAVEMLKESGKSQVQVSRELGIADSSLSKWVRQYEAGEFSGSAKKVQSSSDKEIARLTAELKRKTMEVEILKKATAFFAKENS
jgi:transposase